ncbi:MAG TPA: RagB/SusD family nutrient uptake outer membrane protein [Bacteroidales bacterium]|nr:MAG: SusD family protein [Bacteroidetes bacterium ADurb.Bin037]HPV88299.1 RagB/SusD family nutrient uptake outer membrane protein [Bacteroidales bacterium]HPW79077.1 RagB/SusD family nutrient uptake outer membrane protein [Bacteroidales bacterium]HQB56714.1 RagB/SusD family nutrient uptake outer membrane protein [Bacteroidales bacterium]
MKKINILLAAICVVLTVSCEGFLDVKPSNSAAAETSITTAADAKVIMNGIMSKMTSYSYYGRNFIMYGDAKGGDFALRSQGRGLDALYTFNHSPSSNAYSGYWIQIYHCLAQVNNLLVNIEKIEAEGSSTNTLLIYKGQALTLRALMYFDLVRLYGKPYNMDKTALGVPLTLEPLDASAQPTRATVEQVYAQILKDLTDGAPLLEKKKTNGYINYYANMAIQARVHLYMENYSAALAAAETVINSKVYTLYTNDNWVRSWTAQFNTESIFELAILQGESDLGSGSLSFYLRRHGHGSTSAMGWFMASDYWLERMNQDPDDVRWGVMDYDESYRDTGVYRYGSCYKYSGSTTFEGDGKGSPTAVNIKVIRLSEVYLIAAEAALGSGNKEKAATYLQAIRKRSPNLAEATAANITVDMILNERSKELFAEGHRFFDMMRLNKTITFNDDFIYPMVVITHREKTIDRTFHKTILPISIDEMNANEAIRSQQNPGY